MTTQTTLALGADPRVAAALLEGLNPEQREVVLHDKGPLLVGALAGSGKTEAVTRRFSYLVRARGVPRERILALTFTRKAAREMGERVAALLGAPGTGDRTIRTFHSLAHGILRRDMPGHGDWHGDAEEESDRDKDAEARRGSYRFLVRKALQDMKWRGGDLPTLLAFIELAKADAARPDSARAEALAVARHRARPGRERDPALTLEAYAAAERLRVGERMLTFADQLVEAHELLQRDARVRARWAARFDYVMVDEHQDSSEVQIQIVEALARDHRNLMVVGDPSQALYNFRGARPEKLVGFAAEWGARTIAMERNYRSGAAILDVANRVLGAMAAETKLDMTLRAEVDHPGVVSVDACATQEDEAARVAREAQALAAEGVPWSQVAVLYRSHALSRATEEALAKAGVPYHVARGQSFYRRPEVRALLAYLRVAARRYEVDHVWWSLCAPNRYVRRAFRDAFAAIGREARASGRRATLAEVAAEASVRAQLPGHVAARVEEWAGVLEELRRRAGRGEPPAELLAHLVEATDFVRCLARDEGSESVDNDRASNVAELARAAARFGAVEAFLAHVDEAVAETERAKREDGPRERVTLSSIHASKGLEYDHVFLITCNDRVLPHILSEDEEEEKRLFYVAVTRARRSFRASWVRVAVSKGAPRPLEPSPYLALVGAPPEPPPRDFLADGGWDDDFHDENSGEWYVGDGGDDYGG